MCRNTDDRKTKETNSKKRVRKEMKQVDRRGKQKETKEYRK
jgi:hypothetical protein